MMDGINKQQKSIRRFDLDVKNICTNMNIHLKSVLTIVKKLKFNVQKSSTVKNKNNTNNNTNQATIDQLRTQIPSAQARLFCEFNASLNDRYECDSLALSIEIMTQLKLIQLL